MKKIMYVPLSKDKVILRTAGIVLIFAFLIAARCYNPFESRLITCGFKELTGYECPTCGMSRSIYSLISLNIADSIKYNPLGILLVLGLFALLIKFAAELISRKEIIVPVTKSSRKLIIISFVLLVFSTWILRLYLKA
jgi:hypothetical protein